MDNDLLNFLITLVLFLVALFVNRGFMCWYFKINERNALIVKQNEMLFSINQFVFLLSRGEVKKEIDSLASMREQLEKDMVNPEKQE